MRFPARLALLFLVAGIPPASGQRQERYSLEADVDCFWGEGEGVSEVFEFTPSAEVRARVDAIVKVSGVAPNFDLFAANVPNAAAKIVGAARKVLYASPFLEQAASTSPFGPSTVLAHEIGHHLNGHTLGTGPDRAQVELQADEFAGFVLCQLGATAEETTAPLTLVSGAVGPGYPPVAARLEALLQGYREARQKGCPGPGDRTADASGVVDATTTVALDASTVASFADRDLIWGGEVRIRDVTLRRTRPTIVVAQRILFEGAGGIEGPDIALIAGEVHGGNLSADGGPGEEGGRILVAAARILGTSISARGGPGLPGSHGQPGSPGLKGKNGRDGDCSPGSAFHGPRAGEPGGSGKDGSDGESGRPGGAGGTIVLYSVQRASLATSVVGGPGGQGGEGGPGGAAGPGGDGGRGCLGLGGHQPDAHDGPAGTAGRGGHRGEPGAPGAAGHVWERPLASAKDLRERLGAYSEAAQVVARMRDEAMAK
jgi:hypothetical protein